MDLHTNKDIKITKNSIHAPNNNILYKNNQIGKRFYSVIKPLKSKASVKSLLLPISTLDVETMEYSSVSIEPKGKSLKQGTQIPVIITLSNKELGNKIFTINSKLIKNNVLLAISLL